MGLFKKVGRGIAGGLDLLSAGFSHPIMTLKSPTQAVRKTKKEGAKKTILRTLGTTALAAGALLGGGTAVGRSVSVGAGKVLGKQVVKRPVKSALTGLSAITVTTALAESPKLRKKTKDVAVGLPKTAVTGGKIIAKTVETGKAPVTPKHALVTGGILAGGVVGAAGIVKATKSIKEKALTPMGQLPSKDVVGSGIPQPSKQIIETPIGAKAPADIPKKDLPSVDIDINLTNKQTNKRFINTGAVVTR